MSLLQITRDNFTQLTAPGSPPLLVEFSAPWCTYCRRLAPTMDQLASQSGPGLAVGQVDIDQEPQLARQFSVEVVPTLLLFQGGVPGEALVAPTSKAQIDAFLAGQS